MRAVWLVLLAVGCHGSVDGERRAAGVSDASVPTMVDAPRVVPAACGDGWDDGGALWAAARDALAAATHADRLVPIDERITGGFVDLRRHDPGLDVQVLEGGRGHRVVVATYECGALSLGGRLWLLTEVDVDRWAVTDERRAPDGEHVTLLAPAPGVYALIGVRWATQRNTFAIQIVRAVDDKWRTLFTRSGLIDLEARQRRDPTFTWAEPFQAFALSGGGPLRAFAATLEPSAQGVAIASTTPWLEALERWCAAPRPARRAGELCNADTAVNAVRVVGDFAAVTLAGPRTAVDCRGEAPASWIASDRGTVVELRGDAGGAWRVVDVRSEDRGCATRVPPAQRSTARAAVRGADSAIVLVRDGHRYWTRGGALMQDGGAVATIDPVAGAAAIDDAGRVYVASAWPPRIQRTAPGGEATTLVEPTSPADGLTLAGDKLYWSTYSTGEVFALVGDQPRVVARGLDRPWGLAAVPGALLVATATGIRRVDLATGQVVDTVLPALAPMGVAVAGDVVAWTEAGGRVMLAVPGQAVRVVATGGRPLTLGLEDHAVVWADASDGTIRQARR